MKKALIVLQKVKGDNSVHLISERLYLGSIGAALNVPELQQVGITHILCTATGVRSMHPDKFSYKVLTVLDSQMESLVDHFADAICWIERALREYPNNKVLVHCFAGRSRSVAVVLAYLIYKLRIPLSVALIHVRQFRANANPNSGFLNQLRAFEYEFFSSKRSFSFDTLHADLLSLIEPAKERLKTMQADGQDSVAITAAILRSSSVEIPPLHEKDVMMRSQSSDAILGVVVGDVCCENTDDDSSESRKNRAGICGLIGAWFLVILLDTTVVLAERLAYPYYYTQVCSIPGTASKLCDGIQHTSPSGIFTSIVSSLARLVKYIPLTS
jgi:protein-tyrosine phosphatase